VHEIDDQARAGYAFARGFAGKGRLAAVPSALSWARLSPTLELEQAPAEPALRSCARCYGDHAAMWWVAFVHPIVDEDGTTWTHWATCPTTGDPVLQRSHDRPRELEPAGAAGESS
jgi:hypothetical protein